MKFIQPPGANNTCEKYKVPTILKNTTLEVVDTFLYLGSIMSKEGDLGAKIFHAFRKQGKRVSFGILESLVR